MKVHEGENEVEIVNVHGENEKINELEMIKVNEGVNDKINNLETVKVNEGLNDKINEVESVHEVGSVKLHEGDNTKINEVENENAHELEIVKMHEGNKDKITEVESAKSHEIEVFHNITTIITERNNKTNIERECWYFNNSKCRYGDRCRKIHKIVQTKYPINVKQKSRVYHAKPSHYRVENLYKMYKTNNTEEAKSYRRGVIQNGIYRERNERTGSGSPIRKGHINESNTRGKVGEDIIQDFLVFLRRKNAMPLSRYMNTRQIK